MVGEDEVQLQPTKKALLYTANFVLVIASGHDLDGKFETLGRLAGLSSSTQQGARAVTLPRSTRVLTSADMFSF